LDIIKRTHTDHYRLKKDSLLQNKRAQQHLYTLLSIIDKTNDKALTDYPVGDLRGLYTTSQLFVDRKWVKDTVILKLLCNKEIETQQYQSKNRVMKILSTINTKTTKLMCDILVLPYPDELHEESKVDRWNARLSGVLKQMKQDGERSYDAYLNKVKEFFTPPSDILDGRKNNNQ
jgi:hypothetical protein